MSFGTINDLVEYFNTHRKIFEKEKSHKQHMERVMSMLSQQNMEILEKEFELYPKGLELPTFIYLMKKLYVPENEISKYFFVSDLIKFFQAIDINGDGHLEWSEFTEYIIENIRRVDRPNYKNKQFQQNEVISSAYSKISNEYKITKVIDPFIANPVKKVVYLGKQQKYFMLELSSNVIRIFDKNFELIDVMEMTGSSHHSFISDFSIDKTNQIFSGIYEGSARFCNLKVIGHIKTYNECEVKKLKNFHKVEFLPLHSFWSFLSKHGELKLCKAHYKSRTMIDFTTIVSLKQHESIITDICEVEEPLYIITSSMDGNVKFYSEYLKKSFQFQHIQDQTNSAINAKFKKGILGIDYAREFGNYVLTYGFCSSIYIYSLDVSYTKGYTGKYNEHSGNLITCKFLRSFPYVLSFDDKLSMRIWDYRKFQTIQVINCEKNFINPTKIQLIPELSQFLVCEKKITQFRTPSLEKKSKEINQFHNIFDFKICSMTNCIFLFTSNDVRVYNYITGCLEKVFTKLTESDFETNITASQFGYKCRKFFIGDAGGMVRQYCSQSGEFLQNVEPGDENDYENKSIVRIIFLKEHSLLIVCSIDGRILIYERNSESEFEIIRDLRETHGELTCAQASARYCTLATGSQDGVVNIWNLEKLTLEGVLVLKNSIKNIFFSPIHPIMIVVDITGQINLFYIRPYEQMAMRNKCFAKLINYDAYGFVKPVSSISFDLVINSYIRRTNPLIQNNKNHQFLCTIGSQDGSISIININEILDRFKIEENHQIFSIKKSMKSQIHSLKATISNEKKRILINGFSNQNTQEINLNKCVKILSFDAHNKSTVQKISMVKENSILLSSGEDKKLKLWSFQGQLNGTIDFFTFKKLNWKIAQMNFYKKLQSIQTTIYSMRLIENKRLAFSQEEFIKVQLLINEYMNQEEKDQYYKWVSVLKRGRSRQGRSRKILKKECDDREDVRDTIKNFDNVNIIEEQKIEQDFGKDKQFNQIYERLVNRIKTKIEGSELPKISRKGQSFLQNKNEKKPFEVNQQLNLLKKQIQKNKEEQKKYEKMFFRVSEKKTKQAKKVKNLMYQTIGEVRRSVKNLQKTTLKRLL